jgi:transposase-like protein
MSRREHRRFTAEQKLEVLREADQPGVTISEVCRRHGLASSVFYRWRAVAQGGSAVALKRAAQRKPRKDDPEERHRAEIERMRAVIAPRRFSDGFEPDRTPASAGPPWSARKPIACTSSARSRSAIDGGVPSPSAGRRRS